MFLGLRRLRDLEKNTDYHCNPKNLILVRLFEEIGEIGDQGIQAHSLMQC